MPEFEFEGRTIAAVENDTLASALFRAGLRVFSFSFQHRRPRGLLCVAGHCPNCMMDVDGTPNVRACTEPVRNGARVRMQESACVGFAPPPETAGRDYEHEFRQTAVAVIGAGRSGQRAAMEHAASGDEVTLISQRLCAPVAAAVNVIGGASCFGLYEGNLLGIVQRNPRPGIAERLIHLRAERVIVATGAYETLVPFRGNDLAGVMLSSGVIRLIREHGVVPGRRAVIVGEGGQIEPELTSAGIEIVATLPFEGVIEAMGTDHVEGIRASNGVHDCDLIVMCGPLVPNLGLFTQAGGTLEWRDEPGAFLPAAFPPNVGVVGKAAGIGLSNVNRMPAGLPYAEAFVCLCSDVTGEDLRASVAAGFRDIETLKRFTLISRGACQGKMCGLAAISLCASETGRGIGETGTMMARPPDPPITLGALAGPRHHPIRRTPMHYQHEALGAAWMDMGDWKRPRYYAGKSTLPESSAVEQEYRAVREHVGIIDVGTLGKLEVNGADAGKLLDKVYTGSFSDLLPGRVRYAVLCDESGVMLDDGTISRLASDRFFVTTTTGNLEFVQQWLEWWMVGSGWNAGITNVTAGYASMNIAGPDARATLAKVTDLDLSTAKFPYMACREYPVAGVSALLMRIGFVGETGWEIHVPAECGADVWRALLEAGREFAIRPFGIEAQRLLRLEKRHAIIGVDTDALTNPFEAGMSWALKFDKPDFIGRRALLRMTTEPVAQHLVGFEAELGVHPEDGAAVRVNGELVGRVTSARYSPTLGRAIGLAWVPSQYASNGGELQVHAGEGWSSIRLVEGQFYDPGGQRLRT